MSERKNGRFFTSQEDVKKRFMQRH